MVLIDALAILGGLLPALLWLAFWLLEDRCQPEPKRLIAFTFLLGALSIFPVLFLEKLATVYFALGSLNILAIWAICEELFKFFAAYLGGMRSAAFDEPLDAVIYMVTAALGFSAMENALFIWTPIMHGDIVRTVVTGDLRFIGASLLHTLASATIGIAIALSWGKPAAVRRLYALCGVILAIALHTMFNFFILGQGGDATFGIFLTVWVGIIAALSIVERVKVPQRDYC